MSSIPILGWLFSDKQLATVETQMMIFLTPHVYYGDEGTVSPDDYFGDEINRMLEKHDPERFRKKIEERREGRRLRRERLAREGADAETRGRGERRMSAIGRWPLGWSRRPLPRDSARRQLFGDGEDDLRWLDSLSVTATFFA